MGLAPSRPARLPRHPSIDEYKRYMDYLLTWDEYVRYMDGKRDKGYFNVLPKDVLYIVGHYIVGQ